MEPCRLENSPIVYYISGREHSDWVLLLHAAFADHNMFRAQAEDFQGAYNVLTLDMIGHGASTQTRRGDGIDKMSEWIFRILQKERIEKIHVVGISLGAVIAQDLANRYPQALKSLACFGGYDINNFDFRLQKDNGKAQTGMMLKAVFSVKWFAQANKKISACTQKAQEEFYEMNLRFPKKSFLYLASLNRMVNVRKTAPRDYPLLIGCGEKDIPKSKTAVEQWKESEPEASTVILEGAGHCVNMDAPELFCKIMKEFWSTGKCVR